MPRTRTRAAAEADREAAQDEALEAADAAAAAHLDAGHDAAEAAVAAHLAATEDTPEDTTSPEIVADGEATGSEQDTEVDTPGTEVERAEPHPLVLTPERLALLQRTLAKDLSGDEFALFAQQCERTGLDPFNRQIHAVVRGEGNRRQMTIQVGIDGFRLIAERTRCYAGSPEPIFGGEQEVTDGNRTIKVPTTATVAVRKIVQGQVFDVTRTAYWDEYYPGGGKPGAMYRKMPHVMLAKCAEAQALRAAFPAELSGIYAEEEMGNAGDTIDAESRVTTEPFDTARRDAIGLVLSILATDHPEKAAAVRDAWSKVEGLPKFGDIATDRDLLRVEAVVRQHARTEADEIARALALLAASGVPESDEPPGASQPDAGSGEGPTPEVVADPAPAATSGADACGLCGDPFADEPGMRRLDTSEGPLHEACAP